MNLAYITTEGAFPAELLKRMIPEHMLDVTYIFDGWHSSDAITAATTLLTKRQCPVITLVDSHDYNGGTVRQQLYITRDILYSATPGVLCEAYIADPESEGFLTWDRGVLEQVVQRSIADDEWATARTAPRETLTAWLGSPEAIIAALDRLDTAAIERLRQHPQLQHLLATLDEAITEQRQVVQAWEATQQKGVETDATRERLSATHYAA